MRVALVMLVAAMVAGEARAADQFDLICHGESRIGSSSRGTPEENRYRIDLIKGQWCEKDCQTVRSFAEVTPTRIFFDREDEPLRGEYILHGVDRVSGAWFFNSRMFGSISRIDGKCEPAPFSGINPQTKF
jgi:hypothetical protein